MKTRLRLLYYCFVICCTVIFSNTATGQINYSANFNNNMNNWDSWDFGQTGVSTCQGNGALRVNIYSGIPYAEAISPSIGTSNGGEVTFNYRYKVMDYANPPTAATSNAENWGFIQVLWSTSENGPFTLLETMNPTNHIESTSCAQRSVTFIPPAGSTVYLAVYTELSNEDSDFFVYFDQVQVTQAPPVACDAAPAASAAIASAPSLCNGASTTLSLNTVYTSSGLTYQWQSSADNVAYANVPTGGTGATYTTTQAASTWYRAIITCTASGATTTSTPVQVVNNGLACLCDIDFGTVEPITLVNFAGINNTSSATLDGSPPLQNFTNVAPGQVTAGQSYTMTLAGNTNDDFGDGYENYFTVFIDWNHDGDFEEANEIYEIDEILIDSNGADGEQITGSIAVPANALSGLTYMRVVKNWYDEFADWDLEYGGDCGDENSGYGQAEDYLLNVTAPVVETIDWVNLQWPATMTFNAAGSDTAYAQAWEGGVTEAAGAGAGITAWIGISPVNSNSNPNTWTTWVPATFNAQAGNNDEYMAVIGAGLTPGTYYYASRFQLNGGTYTYGGYAATGGGYWDGTANVSGVLTVTCDTAAPVAPATQTFCSGSTVANLAATGTVINWYSAATGGTSLAGTTTLVNGSVYYASITPAGGCESTTRTAVTVTVTTTAAPTAPAAQTFCAGSTVANLAATGTVINWYSAATGGTPLAGTTALVNGSVYYASITPAGGCESTTRTAVTVTVTTTPAPAAPAAQSFCSGSTVANLVATGTVINWYSAATGGTPLGGTTALVNGSVYYASNTPAGGCESTTRTAVTVTITTTAAPAAPATQTFCQAGTVANLTATGTVINWYSAASGGTALAGTTALVDGSVYYASITPAGGCESVARTPVTVDITAVNAPGTAATTQDFCGEADFDDIELNGTGEIAWYAAANGGAALDEDMDLVSGTTYYASQTVDGCESTTRTGVTVQINTTAQPGGDQTQEISVATPGDATIEDIVVTATGTVTWYANEEDAEEGENALEAGTVVTSGTYYATQTIDGCESMPYAVTLDVTMGNDEFNSASFTYHPNPVQDVLTLSYDKNISAIEVYNLLGQTVISKSVNQNQSQVDMSHLSAGTYLVKVTSDTVSRTIKVVKQ